MLKQLLLQFIVSLAPACAFQLYMHKQRLSNRASLFIVMASSASLFLCMQSPIELQSYFIDFRSVPLIIGVLYGGRKAILFLSIVFFSVSFLMPIPFWEMLCGSIVFLITAAILFRVHGTFNRASAHRKERIVVIISILSMALGAIVFFLLLVISNIGITSSSLLAITIATAGTVGVSWLSVYMIEIVRENQLLHTEVLRVSSNYENEVVKLQQFIDETTSAVLIVDRRGRVTHINEIALELLSFNPKYNGIEGLIGLSISSLFKMEGSMVYRNHIEDALKGNKEMLIPTTRGERSLLHTSFPLRNLYSNRIVGAALIVYDATEITKLRMELTQMDRLSLVGQMAASITHEIRNPMAVVRGFVQLIKERSPSQNDDYFQIILDELDRTNSIINDFLSLAQNRVVLKEMSFINEIIRDILPLLQADANLRGQTIEVDYDDNIPSMMLDRREIKQLLLNIARNGMEAMKGKGILHISTVRSGNSVKLNIADNGEGISQDKIKQLFEPFYTTKTQGTGLGLPLCLSIAERHNGRIDVESTEGEGTVFIVTFQLDAS